MPKVGLPKVSRASQLILILGIFLIVFLALFMVAREQMKAQEELKNELSSVRIILAKPPPRTTAELEAKIRQAELELQTARGLFSDSSRTLDIADSLLELAMSCQVEIVSMATGTATPKVGDVTYNALSFDLGLKGQVASLLIFITRLTDELPTAEISSTDITKAVSEKEMDTAMITIYVCTDRKD